MLSYDAMRPEILRSQPHLLVRFLKSMRFKDGTMLEDRFEDSQRRSFATDQRRDSDALGRYLGPNYEQWRHQSLEMQRKIDAAKLSSQITALNRKDEGLEYER